MQPAAIRRAPHSWNPIGAAAQRGEAPAVLLLCSADRADRAETGDSASIGTAKGTSSQLFRRIESGER